MTHVGLLIVMLGWLMCSACDSKAPSNATKTPLKAPAQQKASPKPKPSMVDQLQGRWIWKEDQKLLISEMRIEFGPKNQGQYVFTVTGKGQEKLQDSLTTKALKSNLLKTEFTFVFTVTFDYQLADKTLSKTTTSSRFKLDKVLLNGLTVPQFKETLIKKGVSREYLDKLTLTMVNKLNKGAQSLPAMKKGYVSRDSVVSLTPKAFVTKSKTGKVRTHKKL